MEYSAKFGPISTKCLPVMQCNLMHRTCYDFSYSLEIHEN